jgi:uncharacterized RDD family membrane protein YckC
MLDTLELIETPEGVDLSVRPAGVYVRVVAKIIDTLVEVFLLALLSVLYVRLDNAAAGLILIAAFVLLWLYNVIFEVYVGGATPGKKVMGLHVVYTNGAPVSLSGSVLRNFLRVVDVLPSLYALGLALALGNARFQRLGDMAAGTVVAYREGAAHDQVIRTGDGNMPLRVALSRDEHQAVGQFAERAESLSRERRAELANLLSPVTGLSGEDAVAALRAHANWLRGRA